jgi:hypothetical protein
MAREATAGRACSARTRAVFPEIGDAQPAGAVLWRARFADQGRGGAIPGLDGRLLDSRTARQLANYGIDHILISASLEAPQARRARHACGELRRR